MELLLHILLWSIFVYYHEMEWLYDVYGFHASMIKLWRLLYMYIYMYVVGGLFYMDFEIGWT